MLGDDDFLFDFSPDNEEETKEITSSTISTRSAGVSVFKKTSVGRDSETGEISGW